MKAKQQVFRVRRNYNRWVANQTLEDYALRFTAKKARTFSAARVSNTALGAISFLALEAIGGAITLSYGFTNAVVAIMVVALVIFLTSIPISYYAARYGIDIDLLTRGAGFGYIGSTITSLIYASFTFIFFALEAAIMAMALELTLGIPLSIGYVISALVVIPIVTYGITLISRFQLWTQPFWVILQLLPFVFIAYQDISSVSSWVDYEVETDPDAPKFNLLLFGAAASVIFSLVAQIGEQVDFLRFLPEYDQNSMDKKERRKWWISLIVGGPGWIIVGAIKILAGSFLAVLALGHGVEPVNASDPAHMYLVAFGYISNSPDLALALAGIFVILSQLKINVTNAYAGSIAWSNFFSRLTHSHPGRVVWLVFNVIIALLLMELGIYQVLEDILGGYAIIALAWVGSLVADLVINKPLGLRPAHIEFKRAHLFDINPVGVGSMLIASIIGLNAHLGSFGETAAALSSFITLGTTFILAPFIAWFTKGKYYIARSSLIYPPETQELKCCICEHNFETEDMAHCPAYEGHICSLCCSLDARCNDVCKTKSKFSEQLLSLLERILPDSVFTMLNTKVSNFLGLFFLILLVIAGLLLLIYFQIVYESQVDSDLVASALWNVSFILIIIGGVMAWLFVLVSDSRRVAEEETNRQTHRLQDEISAHGKTDQALQLAKENAEAANLAKSRYLTGISHELRTPLNAVLGYAQLLDKDPNIPVNRRNAVSTIRRSGEYLGDLIEGLLDISKIEAKRLDIHSNQVRIGILLNQIVNMFELQAQAKGIKFSYECLDRLPEYVKADEQRLRQILINLLSNALKFTEKGEVKLSVRYRSQVAEFKVSDTGRGIDIDDQERIFDPFERIRRPGMNHVSGTGLGLTITKLLTEIMGGDISIVSSPNKGSTFKVSLMLSSIAEPIDIPEVKQEIQGYTGALKTVMVVDDDPSARGLITDVLAPLGFDVIEAQDGLTCLIMLKDCSPDIMLIDVEMPGLNGWETVTKIRQINTLVPIIMVSANANEGNAGEDYDLGHDDYLCKPIRLLSLMELIGKHLELEWEYLSENLPVNEQIHPISEHQGMHDLKGISDIQDLPDLHHLQELQRFAEIGYAKGIQQKLDTMKENSQASDEFIKQIEALVNGFQFERIIEILGQFR
jgi:signal transduction histidine kinase/purine-cytosine permease-like protein/ActR/RegA family two-component response regulator